MLRALLYSLIASSSLLMGATLAVLLARPRHDRPSDKRDIVIERATRAALAFGAGLLICTLTFDLMEEAHRNGGIYTATLGFLAGAATFIVIDFLVDANRLDSWSELRLVSLLDGIPESAVIGIGLVAGESLGFAMMIAVFLSNFPEAFSWTLEMLAPKALGEGESESRSPGGAFATYGFVAAACTLSTVAGYTVFRNASPGWISLMLAFASGSILALVSHTMIPEAFGGIWEYRDRRSGARFKIGDKVETLSVIGGFLLAFAISRMGQ